MSESLELIVLSASNWLHLLATVVWIGGMSTNLLILFPSLKEGLEPPAVGRLMGIVMKRFRSLVYASMCILAVSGVVMNLLNTNYLGLLQFGNLWSVLTLIKHIFTLVLVVLAVYAFEGLGPKVAKAAAKGPFPELGRLQKKQMTLAVTGFTLGLAILLLTGIVTAISSAS